MAAISKITINGFKAFPNLFDDLVLNGNNLLMYGENGSGKSSIYYALHCLLQSQCNTKGHIYFNPDNPESIVNKDTHKDDAFVEIQFEGSDTRYRLSKNGYEEIPKHDISPLRDLNGECVFINHKFLFHLFSFRNSQYIDLFPVFIKDILPFVLTRDKAEFISQVYDDVMKGIKRHGRSNKLEESYIKRIRRFNKETKYIIDLINTGKATDIYNNNFRDDDERQLKITLGYEEHKDNVPQPNTSYWLRCGYRYQIIKTAGKEEKKCISSRLELLQPVITLKVEEKQEDGSYHNIDKPQSYFNEAKLTAIALSIRFSLLDTISASNGRFMALDDMLISLDMSNRAKVVKYLLDISDKYKLYIFTHDRMFFEYMKEHIFDFIERKNMKIGSEWIFKELYKNIDSKVPVCYNSDDAYTRAIYLFRKSDYPASANYLRKAVEEVISLYPRNVLKSDNGLDKEKLRGKIDAALLLLKRANANLIYMQDVKSLLGILLNPLSHRSIDRNVYQNDLKLAFKTIPLLKEQILNLSFKEIVAEKEFVHLCIQENANTICDIEILLDEALYSYTDKTGNRQFTITLGRSVSSTIERNGIASKKKHEYNKGSLEDIYKQICEHLKIPDNNYYLSNYYYKNVKLINKIK